MELADVIAVLTRTPNVLEELIGDRPDTWVRRDDGPGTWSAYDIVGHLLHGEVTDWMPRTRMILSVGRTLPFESFDREAMLGAAPSSTAELLAQFRTARAAGVDELVVLHLRSEDLDRRGLHPDLGEVTLGQLLATWVAHDLTHIAQAAEVLARRYRDEVGPWRGYLPALDRVADAE